jgi:hypothetical protein
MVMPTLQARRNLIMVTTNVLKFIKRKTSVFFNLFSSKRICLSMNFYSLNARKSTSISAFGLFEQRKYFIKDLLTKSLNHRQFPRASICRSYECIRLGAVFEFVLFVVPFQQRLPYPAGNVGDVYVQCSGSANFRWTRWRSA